jgi:hypothetical protein
MLHRSAGNGSMSRVVVAFLSSCALLFGLSTIVASTADAAVPNAPTSVSVSYVGDNAVVTWTAPLPVTGVTITGYLVTSSPGSLTCTVAFSTVVTPAPACTVPDVAPSTSYTFSVVALSSGGTGPAGTASLASPALTASTISVSAAPLSPENLNTAITFTAAVTTGATGTVEFENSGTLISGCQYRVVNAGYATCTTSWLTAATRPITAIYSGDSNYATSTSSALSYTISGSTLTAATTLLAVSSTGAAINTTISIVVTGGNGSGAVTLSVVNGSATGCSISGTTLSVPVNVSGTCLVTATQASGGTYLGDVSNVALENFFWNYLTYQSIYFYCTSGDTLSGESCTHETYVSAENEYSGYYCSSGWSGPITGNVCWRDAYVSHATCTANGGTWEGSYCYLITGANYGTDGGAFGYYCLSGDVLISGSCYAPSTYVAFMGFSYSCPYGGTLSGSICSISGGSGPNLRPPRRSSIGGSSAPPGARSASLLPSSSIAPRSSEEAAS